MIRAAVVAAVGLLLLAGCAAPDPEPAPDLAPEFLAIICPANDADLAFNAVWEAEASTFEEIVKLATVARDVDAQAAASLDALAARWPEEYRTDLGVISEMYVAKSEDYSGVVAATDIASFSSIVFHNPTAGNAAYERIAQRLNASIEGC